jgi:hypothetical protein
MEGDTMAHCSDFDLTFDGVSLYALAKDAAKMIDRDGEFAGESVGEMLAALGADPEQSKYVWKRAYEILDAGA